MPGVFRRLRWALPSARAASTCSTLVVGASLTVAVVCGYGGLQLARRHPRYEGTSVLSFGPVELYPTVPCCPCESTHGGTR